MKNLLVTLILLYTIIFVVSCGEDSVTPNNTAIISGVIATASIEIITLNYTKPQCLLITHSCPRAICSKGQLCGLGSLNDVVENELVYKTSMYTEFSNVP